MFLLGILIALALAGPALAQGKGQAYALCAETCGEPRDVFRVDRPGREFCLQRDDADQVCK